MFSLLRIIIIDCLFISFDMLYFSTDGCINKSLTYLLTYLLTNLGAASRPGFVGYTCFASPWTARTIYCTL